jgi:hypothetical protein
MIIHKGKNKPNMPKTINFFLYEFFHIGKKLAKYACKQDMNYKSLFILSYFWLNTEKTKHRKLVIFTI